MQGTKKSPLHGLSKHTSADTRRPVNSPSNPFDSDDELDSKKTLKSSGRISSRPSVFTSADTRRPVNSPSNPFDSDDELDSKKTLKSSGRISSRPSVFTSSTNPFEDEEIKGSSSSQCNSLAPENGYQNDFGDASSTNPFEDEDIKVSSSSQSSVSSTAKNRYKNTFRDSGGLENQSVQELENYAAYRAEETTKTVNNCLKIAEDIREDATKTLVTLHQQGEQISRTHMVVADMDHDLSRGEKLLGSLGGIFSKTWKPKKTRPITGPVITRDDPVQRKGNHLEQRERLGLTSASKERSRIPPPDPTNAMQKVEVEKVKQDDALADLSNILGDLKEMAIDMGSEIDRQNKAMDHVQDDVEELSFRVKGANQRTRRLLGR